MNYLVKNFVIVQFQYLLMKPNFYVANLQENELYLALLESKETAGGKCDETNADRVETMNDEVHTYAYFIGLVTPSTMLTFTLLTYRRMSYIKLYLNRKKQLGVNAIRPMPTSFGGGRSKW